MGLRERRRRESAERLIDLAREWTARDGFTGYTIEELCEAAGVSRRTFFNYFASKEDAVLGILVPRGEDELQQSFLDKGQDAGSGASLLDDFVELHLARWELVAPTASQAHALHAAFDREPRLHARMIEQIHAHEQRDIALIEKRENFEPGDIRASTLVHLVGAFSRAAAEEYFRGHSDAPPSIHEFSHIFARRIHAARDLLNNHTRITERLS